MYLYFYYAQGVKKLPKEITYLFGRLNLISYQTDKKSFIINSLRTDKQFNQRDNEWGFFNIQEISINDNDDYIQGDLVKYKSKSDEEIVDIKSRKTTNTSINDRLLAKSPFLLHIHSGLIAYHPVSSHIDSMQFRQIFARLIEEANDRFFVDAEIQAVNDEIEITYALKSFDKISTLKISLHPSNPSNRRIWKETDDKLKKMRAHSLKAVYNNDDDGLIINETDEIYGQILMASDGYGKAELIGFQNNEKKTASTEKVPMKISVMKDSDVMTTIESIISMFRKIWDRTRDK